MSEPAKNTDRELWRERAGDFYADSIHVTAGGGIVINCGGHVIVRTLREWHKLASEGVPLKVIGWEGTVAPGTCPRCFAKPGEHHLPGWDVADWNCAGCKSLMHRVFVTATVNDKKYCRDCANRMQQPITDVPGILNLLDRIGKAGGLPASEHTECSAEHGHFRKPGTDACYCGALLYDGNVISLKRADDAPRGGFF
jgi:hypothetical protein